MTRIAGPVNQIWDVGRNLEFSAPLEADDPRLVETDSGRGVSIDKTLMKLLGLPPSLTMDFRLDPGLRKYIVLYGHLGSGKSTELRRMVAKLQDQWSHILFVCFVDVMDYLDPNRMEYAEVLLLQAQILVKQLEEKGIQISSQRIADIQNWFQEKIILQKKFKDFAAEITSGMEGKTGLPLIFHLFSKFTAQLKAGVTYAEELRIQLKNQYSSFTVAFQALIQEAESRLDGARIIFITDGTDKMSGEGTKQFFINNSSQLQQVQSLFLYTAPIQSLYESNLIRNRFDELKLPMIKYRTQQGEKVEKGFEILRNMVFQRIHPTLFEANSLVDKLVVHSGGSPRELLKLLWYAYLSLEDSETKFTERSLNMAIRKLATDYRRILAPEDYLFLYQVDHQNRLDHTEQAKRLLLNSAILEYNDYWWRSHPAIQTLEAYQNCAP